MITRMDIEDVRRFISHLSEKQITELLSKAWDEPFGSLMDALELVAVRLGWDDKVPTIIVHDAYRVLKADRFNEQDAAYWKETYDSWTVRLDDLVGVFEATRNKLVVAAEVLGERMVRVVADYRASNNMALLYKEIGEIERALHRRKRDVDDALELVDKESPRFARWCEDNAEFLALAGIKVTEP